MTKHRAVGGVENMWVLKTHLLVTWRLITDSSLFMMSFTKCWMSTYCVSLTIQPDSSFYFDCWLLFNLSLLSPVTPHQGGKLVHTPPLLPLEGNLVNYLLKGSLPHTTPNPSHCDENPTYFHFPKPAWTSAIKFLSNSLGVWSVTSFDAWAKFGWGSLSLLQGTTEHYLPGYELR